MDVVFVEELLVNEFIFGSVCVNFDCYEVIVDESFVWLIKFELDFLKYFVVNEG